MNFPWFSLNFLVNPGFEGDSSPSEALQLLFHLKLATGSHGQKGLERGSRARRAPDLVQLGILDLKRPLLRALKGL